MTAKKIEVVFFQRKPRIGFNFSLEYIFEDIRKRLADEIDAKICISKYYNDGYLSKFINIVSASIRQGDGVNHITGETHFLNLFMNKNRVILTIMDCGMITRKTGLAQKIVKWLYLSAPIKKAKIITSVSERTKQEIISYTGINPADIRVIPVMINPIYQPMPKLFNKEKPVVLQIGTGYNKNLLRLIEALKGITCHLTIVGKLSGEHLLSLEKNQIEFSNEYNISNERLLEKYDECDILAFVSTFEGFGMPIIEANAVERVVITSNISSMPEVALNSACLVNPYSVNAIRSGIIRLINDDAFRETLINNGKINKLRFEGDKIANMYLDLYKEITL
jgi:glycosyltransferase involved in cell wall biosynthesis